MTPAVATEADEAQKTDIDVALERMIGVSGVNDESKEDFIPSTTWQGAKQGFYFGTSEKGTGYYRDSQRESRKRKRITIDEGRNEIKSIPARLTAEELLHQAEETSSQIKLIDLTSKGITQAMQQLEKLKRRNALQRAQYSDSPEQYLESELALHEHLSSLSAIATQPQLLPEVPLESLVELLSHENPDIATTVIHILVEWLDPDQPVEVLREVARAMKNSGSFLDFVSNLGRLQHWQQDEEDQQGVEDILTFLENLIEIDQRQQEESDNADTVASWFVQNTSIISWLVLQLPSQHARSAEILSFFLQQPEIYSHIQDWSRLPPYSSLLVDDEALTNYKNRATNGHSSNDDDPKSNTINGVEFMLQAIGVFRKRQPETALETDFLENVIMCLASILTFSASTSIPPYLDAQGPQLIVRCIRERVHAGGAGLALLEVNDKRAIEYLVSAADGLRYLFPLFMGRGIPKLALSSSNQKSRKEWLLKLEAHLIGIFYNFSRFLDDRSPEDAKQRFLVKFLDHDCEKVDRLVELLLAYDQRARNAEYKYYRFSENEDDMAALAAKLEGGGDLFHRLGAVCGFICVHSKRCHQHLLEQLALQQSGISLVKAALHEFISVLADDDQKAQLQSYLSKI